ncbi:MAG: MotA/TolQ/ExbB proton channel family protein [Sphingomonadaceae bacterium]|nr:MotA/TolQ/ExbB proton channel family protein [Sphingomonadaceae bacterium]
MQFANLFNGQALAIVAGGTFAATVLRCGFTDCRLMLSSFSRLGRRKFDADHVRAELAVQVQEIQHDGLIRASPHQFGDRDFDEAADVLIASRSISGLLAAHENHKTSRLEESNRAVNVLTQSADLAPAFGLVGTLLSLSQFPTADFSQGSYAAAISMAVLTTLYGLLLSNLLLAPLARILERAAMAEERARQNIVDWLAEQLAKVVPHPVMAVPDAVALDEAV